MATAGLRVWVDAQLPPALAHWIEREHGLTALHVQDVGLLDADEMAIFEAARLQGAVVMTKDEDFVKASTVVYVAVPAILLATALAAVIVPALRAARVDPIRVLRAE